MEEMELELPDTTAPLLSPWTVRFLLEGPAAAGAVPRDPTVRAELKTVWGSHGERCGPAWTANEVWLRQAAAERGITPRFKGLFFSEALATGR